MKKFLSLLFAFVMLTACQENLERNEPAFQAEQDGVFWRALSSTATINPNGTLSIKAFTAFEEVELTFPSTAPGSYALGESDLAKATYKFTSQDLTAFYETGNGIGGGGELTITANNIASDGTIIAEFRFRAIKTSGSSFIPNGTQKTFTKGWIYKVKVTP